MVETHEDDAKETNNCIFTVEDFKDLAKSYLSLFFKNKVDEDGNEIEPEVLHTQRNISLVLNLDICNGMPVIYDALKPVFRKEILKTKGKIPGEIEFVLKMLKECSKLSIPKSFAAGLVAVHVEVCKGIKLDYEV
jgi:hypothetical protein